MDSSQPAVVAAVTAMVSVVAVVAAVEVVVPAATAARKLRPDNEGPVQQSQHQHGNSRCYSGSSSLPRWTRSLQQRQRSETGLLRRARRVVTRRLLGYTYVGKKFRW